MMDPMSTPSGNALGRGIRGAVKLNQSITFFSAGYCQIFLFRLKNLYCLGITEHFSCVISVLMEFSYIIVKTFKYFLVSESAHVAN